MAFDDHCSDCGRRFELDLDENGQPCFDKCPDCERAFMEWASEREQSA